MARLGDSMKAISRWPQPARQRENEAMHDDWMTAEQAAHALGVTPATGRLA
jgi:hypothetical protein